MKALSKTTGFAALLLGGALQFASAGPQDDAPDIAGRWDAALTGNGPDIAFRLDIAGEGPALKATFYDGPRAYETTTSASFEDGRLVLDVGHYLTKITAELKDGKLVGTTSLQGPGYSTSFGFRAARHVGQPSGAQHVPYVAGNWELPLASPSSKGEKAWRLIVDQRGAEVAASILRVDGDTGSFSGTYRDGKWVLSHFDGHRPGLIEIAPGADGTLAVRQSDALLRAILSDDNGDDKGKGNEGNSYADERYAKDWTDFVAYRSDAARAKGLPEPADYLKHTSARDATEKFAFNFPDLDGKLRSQDDPYFKGNVIVAIVTGTWCPNCHDEAQYLVELDRKYRAQGLRIVALNFEEVEQQDSQARARAFVKQYGVEYPYLLAGAPAEMWEKVPQLVNLNTWPTTVFVGRDGTVRAVHAGFASQASGEFHSQLREQFTQRIEQLLAERAPQAPQRTAYNGP